MRHSETLSTWGSNATRRNTLITVDYSIQLLLLGKTGNSYLCVIHLRIPWHVTDMEHYHISWQRKATVATSSVFPYYDSSSHVITEYE
jgi:hypothetical protein